MKLVVTARTLMDAARGNVAVANLFKNRDYYRLEFHAPARLASDAQVISGETKLTSRARNQGQSIKDNVSELLSYVILHPSSDYDRVAAAASSLAMDPVLVDYIALVLALPADGLWDDGLSFSKTKATNLQVTTKSLYSRVEKVFHIFATASELFPTESPLSTEIPPSAEIPPELSPESLIGTIYIAESQGPERAKEIANYVDNWILTRLDDFPDLKDVAVIKTYEVGMLTLQGNYKYAEIGQCSLRPEILEILKQEGEEVRAYDKKKLKCLQIRELLISYTEVNDAWEFPEDADVYMTGSEPSGPLESPEVPESKLPESSNTDEIFIPQDVLGYDPAAFQEEYLTENTPSGHTFEEIEELGFDINDLRKMDRLIVFYKLDGAGHQTIISKYRISEIVREIWNMFQNNT